MVWCCTEAAKAKADPKKAVTGKGGKVKAQARNNTSGDEAARSAARPAVSRVTRSQKNLDAGSDTAATHAHKRGKKAATKSVTEASLRAVGPTVEEGAGAATELSHAAPSGAGRFASKHQAEQAPAAVDDQGDSTAADSSIGKVQGGSKSNLAAPAASTQCTDRKLSRKAVENANAAAEHAEIGDDQTAGAAVQVAPRKKVRKKAQAAAEASNATETSDAAKTGAADIGVKHKKKRGRPAKHAEESGRHVRQKRVPIAAGVASKSVYDYDG